MFGLGFLVDFPFFDVFFALLLIYLGLRLMLGKGLGWSFGKVQVDTGDQDRIHHVSVFSSNSSVNASQDFQGGEFVTVFGENRLDLSAAVSQSKRIELSLVSVFGTLKLQVPADWEVVSDGVGILGTFNNNSARPKTPKSTLVVDGAAVFGVIEITS